MPSNFWIVFVAALVPLIIGFIWYNPKVLGKQWMAAAGLSEEKMQGANMGLMFGLTYLLSVFFSAGLMVLVVHQLGALSLLSAQPDFAQEGSASSTMLKQFFEQYGNSYRTFKHGAFHGVLSGIMIALPILGINAMFERKGFKYVAINVGFWIVCMALMGGIVCAGL
jgi:hypothetical protein